MMSVEIIIIYLCQLTVLTAVACEAGGTFTLPCDVITWFVRVTETRLQAIQTIKPFHTG